MEASRLARRPFGLLTALGADMAALGADLVAPGSDLTPQGTDLATFQL